MVHLHVRSWFSFLDGASSPAALAERAANFEQSALAITDTFSVAGAVQHAQACQKFGIRPIIGASVVVDRCPLVLLCADGAGYANLCDLLTIAHRTRLAPSLTALDIEPHTEGLFCLLADSRKAVNTSGQMTEALSCEALLSRLRRYFPNRLFVELAHHTRPGDAAWMRSRNTAARDLGLPTLATNAVRYAAPSDYSLHDALLCMQMRTTVNEPHPMRPVNNRAFLCEEQKLIGTGVDPIAIANTEALARECDVDMLPGFVTPPSAELPAGVDAAEYLKEVCRIGYKRRYPRGSKRAREMLLKELKIIHALELDEFFLVVREVVEYARSVGIRCSGRGSAANSVVAFLLGITEVDPIKHNLLFERFLHEGRNGMPDIDVDFDSARRDEVIAWMAKRFGEAHTAMTANVNTFRLRSAVREVAHILGMPLSLINELAKTLPHASCKHIEFYRGELVSVLGESPAVNVLTTYVAKMQGCPHHLSLHSGGMILSRQPLRHISPIQTSANGVRQVQFAKDDVEALGLIKFDVLGLRMLSVVSETMDLLRASRGKDAELADIDNLEDKDPKTYEMIRAGKTLAMFQIESPGQWNLLSRSQPENMQDLIAQVALFRPGPLQGNMVHPFIERRRGRKKNTYPHPSLIPALRDTHGIILFQEQVLEVAHMFAGMNLSQADEFRRLMSKFRDPGEMEAMRAKFVEGAIATHSVHPALADRVFDLVSKFVGYGFCRSHAAAFARTVYQSAYLKAHYPAAYMAAFLQHLPGFYPLQTILEEARIMGVTVLPVDVNRSMVQYSLEPSPHATGEREAIRIPFTQLHGLSEEDSQTIVLERAICPFTSLEDFVERLPLDKDVLEVLARSGALDAFGTRRGVLWKVRQASRRKAAHKGQARFDFGSSLDAPRLQSLTAEQIIEWDFQTQGLTTGPHPVALHRVALNRLGATSIQSLENTKPGTQVRVGGAVISRQRPPTAKGMTFIILEDETGRLPTAMIPEMGEKFARQIRSKALLIEGRLEDSGFGAANSYRSILIDRVWPMASVLGGYAGHPGQMAR